LFNQPHPARAAVPWQPNAGIAEKLSSRGYASTSWATDAPEAFADLGFPAKSSGFSAAHYQPTKQPLSKQAQASLALLEGECRNEAFGEEKPASVAGTETNEHLPFVMDAYGASRKSKLRVNVDASVLQRALAQAEMAETLVVSPITSDEKTADPIVIHPDVADDTSVADAQEAQALLADTEAKAAEAAEAAAVEAAAAIEAEAKAAAEVAAQAALAAAEVAETALPAVVGGIAPEEVEQREAEQFAKGLAQAREEAAIALAEAVAKATEEALAQGIEQGKAEGLAEGLEQGKEEGMAAGDAKVRAELIDEMVAQRVLFENISSELGALMADPKKFFEPLKRLALHVAEQVVVGELQTSSKAIERLVQRCLDELDHPVHGAVVLELNPEDKVRLQAQAGDFIKGMRLEAVPDLKMGSVRVFANDTVVEDLVEHRLEGLAKALCVDVDAWREKSPLAKEVVDVQQEEAEDGDVHS
jgi:flagellar biosynthesis/type III secretory pathway protein FliH